MVNAGDTDGRPAWKVATSKQTYANGHPAQLPPQDDLDVQ